MYYYFNVIGGTFAKGGKVAAVIDTPEIPVEKDPEKLVNYVSGSNIYKEGEDIKLQDDNEYPEWIWNLR